MEKALPHFSWCSLGSNSLGAGSQDAQRSLRRSTPGYRIELRRVPLPNAAPPLTLLAPRSAAKSVRRSVIGGCLRGPAAIGCLGLFVPGPRRRPAAADWAAEAHRAARLRRWRRCPGTSPPVPGNGARRPAILGVISPTGGETPSDT